MDYTNERAPSHRGAGGATACSDDHDPITTTPGKSKHSALLTALRAEHRVIAEYRPLSLAIRGALHAAVPGVAHKLIDGALALHCHRDAYLQAIAAGGPRYGLDGTPSGEVSEEHRAAAVLVLARRKEKAVKSPRAPVASVGGHPEAPPRKRS